MQTRYIVSGIVSEQGRVGLPTTVEDAEVLEDVVFSCTMVMGVIMRVIVCEGRVGFTAAASHRRRQSAYTQTRIWAIVTSVFQ